jgi:molecular chaperone GrpE
MSKYSHYHKNTAGSHGGAAEAKKEQTEAGENQESPGADLPEKDENLASPETGPANMELNSAEPGSCEQKYAELEVKFAELNDQYLRKAADFENFRKRMNREKQEIVEFSNQNLLLDLLPVIDDFERAIKSAETSQDFASFYEGIIMIEKRLSTELEKKWGLKRFDSEGQPFDPNRHEALQMEKAAGITEALVKDDFLKGYFLKDRVIRFAKVKVLVPDGAAAGQSDGEVNDASSG